MITAIAAYAEGKGRLPLFLWFTASRAVMESVGPFLRSFGEAGWERWKIEQYEKDHGHKPERNKGYN